VTDATGAATGREEPARIDFLAGARLALGNEERRAATAHALATFRAKRAAIVAQLPEWEAWREEARTVKAHTLAHLDTYLDRLDRSVRGAGGQVHWAGDGAEACAIILELARRSGVRRVAKSKSSTTSEIGLNPALEAAGIEVTETDLGEFIVQLSGEEPSHFVVPAIHLGTPQVADLLAQRLGIVRVEDPERLTRAAREHLRETFLTAEMGISGVNFAVAETGTLVVFENEGNARMVTSLPRVHLAVMGMEKVVPRLTDLAVMLRVLPLSAVGTRMAEYVSLLTGPRRRGEADGPDELHLIILDNGRSRILADPETREALQCIRCGACLNVCPVYERAGGHAYGSIYSGPIGAVLAPLFRGVDAAGELPFASTLCGACAEVCPVKIDIPRLLLTMRQRTVQHRAGGRPTPRHPVGVLERLAVRAFAFAATSPRRWRWGGRILRAALRPFVRKGSIPALPLLRRWTRYRHFPAPPPASFSDSRSVPGDTHGT
jgi:L-lactate dehydrogenase complex protein LldF